MIFFHKTKSKFKLSQWLNCQRGDCFTPNPYTGYQQPTSEAEAGDAVGKGRRQLHMAWSGHIGSAAERNTRIGQRSEGASEKGGLYVPKAVRGGCSLSWWDEVHRQQQGRCKAHTTSNWGKFGKVPEFPFRKAKFINLIMWKSIAWIHGIRNALD